MTRLTTGDIDQAVYERQRAARREDRVLQTVILPAWADRYADVLAAADIERQSRAAAEAIRRERAAAHRRMWLALDHLKEQQP